MDLLGSCVRNLQRGSASSGRNSSEMSSSQYNESSQVAQECPSFSSPEPSPMIEPTDSDLVSCLPREIALNVFSFLEPRDIASAARTCHFWHGLAEDDILWRQKSHDSGFPDERETFFRYAASQGFTGSLWKVNFARSYSLNRNWRFGGQSCKRLVAHRGHLVTCLLFASNNRLISGSDDGTMKVWCVLTGQLITTLVGHSGGVWAAEAEDDLLVSGATDKTVRIWNLRSGAAEGSVLYGHGGTVRCLALKDGVCVSGSRDTTLRIWNLRAGNGDARYHNNCHVLFGHTDSVRCVRYNGQYIVSGSYDSQLRVWDPVAHKCLHVLIGHTDRVYALQFDGLHIVSGSLDSTIRVWDVRSGVQKHALMGHETFISSMYQRDNLLVSGTADSAIRLWDIRTGACLRSFGNGEPGHESAVTSVHFDLNFVVSSSDDGTCKLWDLHTGNFIRDIVTLPSRREGGIVWRIVANQTKLVCAVGSRNDDNVITDVEETKLLVFNYDVNFAIENGRSVWPL